MIEGLITTPSPDSSPGLLRVLILHICNNNLRAGQRRPGGTRLGKAGDVIIM